MDAVAIDEWILMKFELFSHFTARWFGVDNFMWARICSICYLMCGFIMFSEALQTHRLWSGEVISLAAMLILMCLIFVFIDTYDHTRQLTRGNFRNIRQVRDRWIRLVLLALLVVEFIFRPIFTIYTARNLAFQCWWYFIACTPEPPGISRVKMFLQSLTFGHAHAEAAT
jgi:hypothetical protein